MKLFVGLLVLLLGISCSLFDRKAPTLEILTPGNEEQVLPLFIVQGTAADNQALKIVEVAVDNQDFQKAEGLNDWYFRVSLESNGTHIITVRAMDYMENQVIKGVHVYVE